LRQAPTLWRFSRGYGTQTSPSRVDLKEIVEHAAVAKILVVEDDPDFGEAVCEILTISGYRASHAAAGVAALQILRAGELPDLILLDLMMPRMDGWEFREALLRNKKTERHPGYRIFRGYRDSQANQGRPVSAQTSRS
jgi:CheY-like chemotaxis protein